MVSECSICGKMCRSTTALQFHMNTHETSDNTYKKMHRDASSIDTHTYIQNTYTPQEEEPEVGPKQDYYSESEEEWKNRQISKIKELESLLIPYLDQDQRDQLLRNIWKRLKIGEEITEPQRYIEQNKERLEEWKDYNLNRSYQRSEQDQEISKDPDQEDQRETEDPEDQELYECDLCNKSFYEIVECLDCGCLFCKRCFNHHDCEDYEEEDDDEDED